MRKSFICLVTLTILMSSGLSSHPGALAADKPAMLYMTEIPGLTMEKSAAPGSALEVVRAIFQKAGIALAEKFVPWNRAVHNVDKSDRAVVIPFSRIPSREKRYLWIIELEPLQLGFVSLTHAIDDYATAKKLKRVGVWGGSSMEISLREAGFNNLVAASSDIALSKMLIKSRIDAWYDSYDAVAWRLRDYKKQGNHIVRFGKSLEEQTIWMSASLSFPKDLANRLRHAHTALKKSGAIKAIYTRYR